MRPRSGKRAGQRLTLAVIYSFLIHALIVLAVVFLHIFTAPKLRVPLFYQVKLVGQPEDASQPPKKETAPPKKEPQPKKTKALPRPKKAAPKSKQAALPELAEQKQKPKAEQQKRAETQTPQPAATSGPVAVTASQQDFKFGWYLALVREKIGQNWRPPPDAKDAKARVIFTVNRSGWVEDVQPDPANSSGTFGFQQAAIRAIRSSNPFPPLPEEFSKLSVSFSVDLMAE